MAGIRLELCYRYTCPDCGHVNIIAHYVRELETTDERPNAIYGEMEDGEPLEMEMGYYEAGPVIPSGGPVVCTKCNTMHIIAEDKPSMEE